ncbi:ACP S-malonyltransferase [Methylocucumis oryzae]|uniref:Malonyl CoA-acyl carrier protein transacylase n=1 Tax=Methylocucumis oryzae TaxID=1632867 RepID=A0A0F3II09_9GAMM|nr:ACP S-malonyltransferase [Methylocucumis oryzae]KJV06440.1 malonyl CoA-ACP transacylase [Methylocucumis oryzae]
MSKKLYNLAFVFPGQGSQSVGMMNNLAAVYPEVRQTFTEASDVLGFDLWQIVTEDADKQLDQTRYTQPAMLTAGVAIWRIWCQQSAIRPGWVAGHSLGEYTALICAEALAFADGLRLVAERGRLMQEAVPEGQGAMAAILGLEDHIVVNLCHSLSSDANVVSAVNFNSPGQVVIAGHVDAVTNAMAEAKRLGAKRALPIPVSVPSHCQLMQSAAEKLGEYLKSVTITTPKATLIHNVDVVSHDAPDVIKNALIEQLYKPVRWSDSIKFMHEQGVTCFVEFGPGKVLQGLNKRIVKEAEHLAIYDQQTLEHAGAFCT